VVTFWIVEGASSYPAAGYMQNAGKDSGGTLQGARSDGRMVATEMSRNYGAAAGHDGFEPHYLPFVGPANSWLLVDRNCDSGAPDSQ